MPKGNLLKTEYQESYRQGFPYVFFFYFRAVLTLTLILIPSTPNPHTLTYWSISMCRPPRHVFHAVVGAVVAGGFVLAISLPQSPTPPHSTHPLPTHSMERGSSRFVHMYSFGSVCVCVCAWEGGCNIYCYFLGFRLGRTSFSSLRICQVPLEGKNIKKEQKRQTH